MRFDSYTDRSVAVAVDLVNSLEAVKGIEHLEGPEALAAFLDEHGMHPSRRPGAEDVEEVRALRDRLRRVFEASSHAEATAILNALLDEARAHPQLAAHDGEPLHIHFAPTDAPIARHLAATAAMGLAVTLAEGGFDRLGVCAWERCRDVFVDASRNRSRRFCDPAVCGNRASAAAYRARRKDQTPA